ncbi:NAD-dependent epimerase/dehydratase family protein [Pediococcus claussenii]|nr:NAD-dependent epimerase/dehydratase family protein [Pediococcus claussenii]ANZ69339.1 NAD-dependent dehydratase [Pediococcus claussenii]ANZ71159.1 NAD-dependent dehydratase [Pediococcus claussenii]
MQTILGSNGQIGHELAEELYQNYTKNLRLVSRNPKKIHDTDEIKPANLLNYDETLQAISGSEIVYFTVGLPMNSDMWESQFSTIIDNVIRACEVSDSKLVFFDNTYMYAKNSDLQVESSPFVPTGRKSTVRAKVATKVLNAMERGELEAVICRAPEFYGPDNTQSITNTMIFNRIKNGKTPFVPISAKALRTLIWTPDASRAMALIGNTKSAYSRTWHLPSESITYQNLIRLCEDVLGRKIRYKVVKMVVFKIGSLFSQKSKELLELLPRYRDDNNFSSDKFKQQFPEFKVTSFEEGVRKIFNR